MYVKEPSQDLRSNCRFDTFNHESKRSRITGKEFSLLIINSVSSYPLFLNWSASLSIWYSAKLSIIGINRHFGTNIIPALCAGEYHFRSEEHTSELQSLLSISYAVLCLNKKTK